MCTGPTKQAGKVVLFFDPLTRTVRLTGVETGDSKLVMATPQVKCLEIQASCRLQGSS